jgi:hypothetical protein
MPEKNSIIDFLIILVLATLIYNNKDELISCYGNIKL